MFWLPIAFVIIFIYFIIHLVGAFQEGKYKYDFDTYMSKKAALKSKTYDGRLEEELKNELKYDNERCKKIVCDFMGGDPVWRDYMLEYDTKRAVLVEMVKRGKLTYDCFSTLKLYLVGKKTPYGQGTSMNVRFILKLEEYLREHFGMKVTVYANSHYFDDKHQARAEYIVLRDFASGKINGHVNADTTYIFLEE